MKKLEIADHRPLTGKAESWPLRGTAVTRASRDSQKTHFPSTHQYPSPRSLPTPVKRASFFPLLRILRSLAISNKEHRDNGVEATPPPRSGPKYRLTFLEKGRCSFAHLLARRSDSEECCLEKTGILEREVEPVIHRLDTVAHCERSICKNLFQQFVHGRDELGLVAD